MTVRIYFKVGTVPGLQPHGGLLTTEAKGPYTLQKQPTEARLQLLLPSPPCLHVHRYAHTVISDITSVKNGTLEGRKVKVSMCIWYDVLRATCHTEDYGKKVWE